MRSFFNFEPITRLRLKIEGYCEMGQCVASIKMWPVNEGLLLHPNQPTKACQPTGHMDLRSPAWTPAWMGDGYVLPGRGATAGFAVAATQQLACSRHWPSPGPSGSGKPDRFDRLLKKTAQIQISNKKRQFNRFPPVSRPVRPVTGWFEW